MEHKLVNNTLTIDRDRRGIKVKCVCGWESTHFSSMAASAAFQDHKENADEGVSHGTT